tara:strand:- start:982 stop:1398 length:417 start_codon:yes stop_codon:yes gene_type:complete
LEKKLHHIAIVCDDIEKNINFFMRVYGCNKKEDIFFDKAQDVKVQFIERSNLLIEILEPLSKKSPIYSFLDKNGSGALYHMAFEVEDLNQTEIEIRSNGGLIVSKSKNNWCGMEVMFAYFLDKNNQKQLVEYVSFPKK